MPIPLNRGQVRRIALAASRPGNGVAAIGDSITQNNALVGAGLIGSGSWFVQACMASQGRLRYVRNGGISGNRTDQMLARIEDDVIAFDPDWCFDLSGVNDIIQGISQATIRANKLAMYDLMERSGIRPIPCTLTPRHASTPNAEIDKLNLWIRWICQTRGYPLCDFEAVTMDPATGGWLATYSTDALHPDAPGTAAMVAKVVADVVPLFPPNAPYTAKTNLTSGGSALTLGNFNADANADGVADGWTGVNTALNATASLVSDAASVFGKWQQLEVTVSGIKYFQRNVAATVGNRYAFSGKFCLASVSSLNISARLLFNNGVSSAATPNQLYPLYQYTADATNLVWYAEAVAPPGTTSMSCDLLVNSGTGTVKWGEAAVVDMTAQGLV